MRTHTSFRATRHTPNPLALLFVSLRCVYRETDSLYCDSGLQIIAHTLRVGGLGKHTRWSCWVLPLVTITVHIDQRPIKASRRVRTTLIHHATLAIEGVPTLLLSPSAAWDSLYGVLSMVCQGGDASRVTNVPTPLSHVQRVPDLEPSYPLHASTLGRSFYA